LLWADEDRLHAQLRVLGGTGFLLAYDDPVGVAREIKAFCV
jgi:hypothetical protein